MTAPLPRQVATCPTCHAPLPGLLSGCSNRPCLRRELDADAAIDAVMED